MPVTRMLTIVGERGQTPFAISIADPKSCDDGQYACAYHIDWPQRPWKGEAFGFDGVQSLLVAMNLIAAHLYTSEYHQKGQILWGGKEDGYGFPLSKCLKGLALGRDKDL